MTTRRNSVVGRRVLAVGASPIAFRILIPFFCCLKCPQHHLQYSFFSCTMMMMMMMMDERLVRFVVALPTTCLFLAIIIIIVLLVSSDGESTLSLRVESTVEYR